MQLLAIAGQKVESLVQFAEKEKIRIPLLSDPTREVIKAYEVFTPIKWDSFRIAIPSTYLLDRQHVIRYSYIGESQFDRPDLDDLFRALSAAAPAPSEAQSAADKLPVFVEMMGQMMEYANGATDTVLQYLSSNSASISALQQTVESNAGQLDAFSTQIHQSKETIGQYSERLTALADGFQEIHAGNQHLSQNVQATLNLMNELLQMTKVVSDMSAEIARISAQTKILALNASIEASRAGEHGKGFAVVAQEVTHLANATDESSHRITAQLTGIEQKIKLSFSSYEEFDATVQQMNGKMTAAAEEVLDISSEIRRSADTMTGLQAQIDVITAEQHAVQQDLAGVQRKQDLVNQEMLDLREDMSKNTELFQEMERVVKTSASKK